MRFSLACRGVVAVALCGGLFASCGGEVDVSTCGDGVIDDDEECDGAGSAGWACVKCVLVYEYPSSKYRICPDGIVDPGEECDAGPLGSATCYPNCTSRKPRCGNGQLDPELDEECDDGNDVPDDGCTSCRKPYCGDRTVDDGETCDSDAGLGTCQLAGFESGVLACTATCQWDTSRCVGVFQLCGNNQIEPGEECDDGGINSDVLPDACRSTCVAAHCGDGVADTDEECDGVDLDGFTCVSRGFDGGLLGCSDACGFDTSACK